MKKIRIAFAGFRHGHIFGLWDRVVSDPRFEIAAACEEFAPAAEAASARGVRMTHRSFDRMLHEAEFDVLAVGDYYGIRGARAIAGLEAGKHVISDKPLCTSLSELDRIRELSSAKKLAVGIMLDLRTIPNMTALHAAVKNGTLGRIDGVFFRGCHPLSLGVRPEWYFEPGKHGGTVNDIAIHALDAIELVTGHRIARLCGARAWNSRAQSTPWFHDCAQVLFALDDGCGVLGDVSYTGLEKAAYPDPFYWRFTFSGTNGIAEFTYGSQGCTLCLNGSKTPVSAPAGEPFPDYLEVFLSEVNGKTSQYGTEQFLRVTETCLKLQALADGMSL